MEKVNKVISPTQAKNVDKKFCSQCGKPISTTSSFCPNCGKPVNQETPAQVVQIVQSNNPSSAIPKSKTTAIVLAVILGLWTWAYTYQRDAWKFWLNLVLSFLTLSIWAIIVAWPWAIIDAAIKSDSYYKNFPHES